jgi:hypothetical protein
VEKNQEEIFDFVYPYNYCIVPPDADSKIKRYLKNDGSRKMPYWLIGNILKYVNDFDGFIEMFRKGIDGKVAIRPVRYGINLYSLKNTQTIEFRCFRGSLKKKELLDCFTFVEEFILHSLNDEFIFEDIKYGKEWNFPPMVYSKEQADGWLTTKHHVELVNNKNRKFWEVQ